MDGKAVYMIGELGTIPDSLPAFGTGHSAATNRGLSNDLCQTSSTAESVSQPEIFMREIGEEREREAGMILKKVLLGIKLGASCLRVQHYSLCHLPDHCLFIFNLSIAQLW